MNYEIKKEKELGRRLTREEFKELLDNESSNTISMHFRLGDYKDIQDCHPLMPYQYYESAILNIITIKYTLFSNISLFLVSWARNLVCSDELFGKAVSVCAVG